MQHVYKNVNFIKIANVCVDSIIFINYIIYKNKLILYNYKIFNESFLIVNFLSKLHIKQWLLLYEIFYSL